jgi:hypothetical protein
VLRGSPNLGDCPLLDEDGELLRKISDPDFHAHTWIAM